MDSALEDFLKRFGDSDPNKFKTQDQKRQPSIFSNMASDFATRPKLNSLNEGISSKGLVSLSGESSIGDVSGLDPSETGLDSDNGSKFNEIAGKGMDLLQATPSVMALASNLKGNQFDTSPDSGGPGKAGGAILQGAVQGSDAGEKIGSVLGGPIGGTIGKIGGAAFGGLASTFMHTKAMKEWRENQREQNLNEFDLERLKRKEEYSISKGLASMENLKDLRQKQLGILN
jgi:hypothetical protein